MIRRLLIANRGEIAIRIARTATDMGIVAVTTTASDDTDSLHAIRADHLIALSASGPAAYLDIDAVLAAAHKGGCDALHPGYGFLSENAELARRCKEEGIVFVGPGAEQLALLGDKSAARALAERCGIPVPRGTAGAVSLEQACAFMAEVTKPMMVKALAGGGGRGIRRVASVDELPAAFERCASEARQAFGDDRLYLEQAIPRARHIEVQVTGDAQGNVIHLGERDCTLQRRHQKLVEIAPSPALDRDVAGTIHAAAVRIALEAGLTGLATVEFLVATRQEGNPFYFMEANPRLQVEHTVTEELYGVDLVAAQLMLAGGASLDEAGLTIARPRAGFVLQARVYAERIGKNGIPFATGGTLDAYAPPRGPGIRVDDCAYVGYSPPTAYDSLLAKVIVSSLGADVALTLARAGRALHEFVIAGTAHNVPFLRAILAHPTVGEGNFDTRFVDDHLQELLDATTTLSDPFPEPTLDFEVDLADGMIAVPSPLTGRLVEQSLALGAVVRRDDPLVVVEAMKMEHVVVAPFSARVIGLPVAPGATIQAGETVAIIEPVELDDQHASAKATEDPGRVRSDLAELLARQVSLSDEGRPAAVARRHAKGARTARENIAAICDPDTFVEYGSLVVAAQRARRSMEELIDRTPGDGLVVGFGQVNGSRFSPEFSQVLVAAFDETVLAGTMGELAREKLKHTLASAHAARRPVVLFAEGGGGRAGDTDFKLSITGWTMDVSSYYQLSRMSGLVPLIGIAHGRCFAANAGMLACCDVIIATKGSNIGVGGPTMIEGGRLGSYAPDQIGPVPVQVGSGVIDLLADDEAHAADLAKTYLSYFQGDLASWDCIDQREARALVPENRLRAYAMRRVIDVISDSGTVTELRRGFGDEIITALVRVEGRALGVIANDPTRLGGAIASDGADKACRFMKLCEAFGLPLLMLCDTPGMMVGPDAEATATVRRMGRMFVTASNLTVPLFTIVTRKAYGIGAELMAGGWFKAPCFLVSWPTGEFGGMNIEGNVRLGHAAELAAIDEPSERQARFEELVAQMHKTGRALSIATHFEIDQVIDPADSRRWIASAMIGHKPRVIGSDRTAPFVDPW